jgi:hypothetical protein
MSRPTKVAALVTAAVAGYYFLRKTRSAPAPAEALPAPAAPYKAVSHHTAAPTLKKQIAAAPPLQSELAREKQIAAAAAAAGLGAPPLPSVLTNDESIDTLDSIVRESHRHADYLHSQLEAVKKGELTNAVSELEAAAEDAEAHAEQVSELIAQDAKVHDDLAKVLTRIPLT